MTVAAMDGGNANGNAYGHANGDGNGNGSASGSGSGSGSGSAAPAPAPAPLPAPASRKRSKWEAEEEDVDIAEREAAEARAKAAAKASRQRAKAAARERERAAAAATAGAGAGAGGSGSASGTPRAAGAGAGVGVGSPDSLARGGHLSPGPQGTPIRGSASSSQPGTPTAAAQREHQQQQQQQQRGLNAPRRPAPPPVPPRTSHPRISGCRSVYCYERLNHIEEGSYGVVFRARDKETGEVVALKKLKMDKEKNGFPITSLREIRTLMEARHPNVVQVKEIVVGDTLTQIFIVMEFVEHDLKTLLSCMRAPFLQSEIKTLMLQLLSAMSLLHANWIVHRDLKTSNLLMNNRGMIKLADFGLARMFGDPLGDMTGLVVTLWYRAPELLLGAKEYSTAIDMWSVGCIFGELILKEPMFPGKNEIDQVGKYFKLLGQPNEDTWPGYSKLPNARSISKVAPPFSALRQQFRYITEAGLDLLQRLLTYDPQKRITAEEALEHPYFKESPAPKHPDAFGSFPSIAAGEKKRNVSPDAPERLADQKLAYQLELDV